MRASLHEGSGVPAEGKPSRAEQLGDSGNEREWDEYRAGVQPYHWPEQLHPSTVTARS